MLDKKAIARITALLCCLSLTGCFGFNSKKKAENVLPQDEHYMVAEDLDKDEGVRTQKNAKNRWTDSKYDD